MDWKFVLILIFAIFVAIFAIQNAAPVDIQFLNLEFNHVSQAVVILVSAIAGAFIVMLFSIIRWIKYKSKLKGSAKSITSLEAEIKQLKQKLEEEIAKGETANQAVLAAQADAQKSREALEAAKNAPEAIPAGTDAQSDQKELTADQVESQTAEEQQTQEEAPKEETVSGIRKWLGF